MDLRSYNGNVLLSSSYSRAHAVDHYINHHHCRHSVNTHSINKQIKFRDYVLFRCSPTLRWEIGKWSYFFKRLRKSLHKKSKQRPKLKYFFILWITQWCKHNTSWVLLRAFKFILSDLQPASYLDLACYESFGLAFIKWRENSGISFG